MKARLVKESIFKPKSDEDVDSLAMELHNMSHEQLMDFMKSYYQSIADRDTSIAARENQTGSDKVRLKNYLKNINDHGWNILYRGGSFAIVDNYGKLIQSNTVQNMDKIYSLHGKIGIKTVFEERTSDIKVKRIPGIIYDFILSESGSITCEFMGKNGENFEGHLEEFAWPRWKGVVGESLRNMIEMRGRWDSKIDKIIKPEELL